MLETVLSHLKDAKGLNAISIGIFVQLAIDDVSSETCLFITTYEFQIYFVPCERRRAKPIWREGVC